MLPGGSVDAGVDCPRASAFGRMMNTCFKKCVKKFHEEDMHVGEMSCTDRCVYKYMDAYMKAPVVQAPSGTHRKATDTTLCVADW